MRLDDLDICVCVCVGIPEAVCGAGNSLVYKRCVFGVVSDYRLAKTSFLCSLLLHFQLYMLKKKN